MIKLTREELSKHECLNDLNKENVKLNIMINYLKNGGKKHDILQELIDYFIENKKEKIES